MLSVQSFDELNQLVGFKRSEDFEDYFGVMELSEGDRKKRISLAEKLEDNFLFALALLFSMQRYGSIDWNVFRERLDNGYRKALYGLIVIDEYMDLYIKSFSYDMEDSTKRHIDDLYYYSHDRARFSAENESNTTWNYSEYLSAIKAGKTRKRWIDIRDRRERETHRTVGGTVKPIDEPFVVGNSFMSFPKDDSMGASSSEIINCRCSIKYF